MIEYTLDDILNFGKNKGESIRDIYQFSPSYIEWLIVCTDDFWIDITLFDNFPKPTPLDPKRNIIVEGENVLSFDMGMATANMVQRGKYLLGNGECIPARGFVFSDQALRALAEKRAGTYEVPTICSSGFLQAYIDSQNDGNGVA